MTDEKILALSQRAGAALQEAGLRLATAESCTGGWVAKAITDVAGSSAWFVCGITSYSNSAKAKLLGVTDITLERHGAVSEETAFEMVEGALYRTEADIALAVTGIAGPDGGSKEKPVGTVCFAWGRRNEMVNTATRHFVGDRDQVRRQSVAGALGGLLDYLAHPPRPASVVETRAISQDTAIAPKLRGATPFDLIEQAKVDLATLLDRLRLDVPPLDDGLAPEQIREKHLAVADKVATQIDFPRAVHAIVAAIQEACGLDADAMSGFAHLDDVGPYTVLHPLHQAIFGENFTRYLKVPDGERASIACAALTSNIAMLDLQEILWRQADPLSAFQQQLVQLHPAWGHEMLVRLGVSDPIWLDAVLSHHERADGKGYPAALASERIPFAARLLALTDIYDAMVMPRQHRPPNPRAALRHLFVERGEAIDAGLSAIAIKGLGIYPPGSFVKLRNGEQGVVIKRVRDSVHPIVRCLIGPRGAPLERPFRRNTGVAMFNIQDVVPRDRTVTLDLRRIWDYRP